MATAKTKVWRVTKDSKAGMMLTEDTAYLIGTNKNFIATGPTGTTISGPINFMTTSENIRSGGMFVQQNDFVKMIPGTIVTPIPQEMPIPPIAIFAYIGLILPAILELAK